MGELQGLNSSGLEVMRSHEENELTHFPGPECSLPFQANQGGILSRSAAQSLSVDQPAIQSVIPTGVCEKSPDLYQNAPALGRSSRG